MTGEETKKVCNDINGLNEDMSIMGFTDSEEELLQVYSFASTKLLRIYGYNRKRISEGKGGKKRYETG